MVIVSVLAVCFYDLILRKLVTVFNLVGVLKITFFFLKRFVGCNSWLRFIVCMAVEFCL